MDCAASLNQTCRGPVLVSASLSTGPSTSDHFSLRISPLRQPVRRSRRMMSACGGAARVDSVRPGAGEPSVPCHRRRARWFGESLSAKMVPTPLRSIGPPAWPGNHRWTKIRTGPVSGSRSLDAAERLPPTALRAHRVVDGATADLKAGLRVRQ